jgi:hypothetical protein
MTTAEDREPSLLAVLREPQAYVIVRSIVTVASGCLLAAVGIAGGLFGEWLIPWGGGWWRARGDEVGLAAGSAAWLLAVRLIWAPVRGRRQLMRPVFSTLAIWISALLLLELLRGPLEIVVALVATSFTLGCWASAYLRWVRVRSVVGPDNVVDVRCPQCRYSLVGLTECRCPECGFAFTLDGVIAAQGYDGTHIRGDRRTVGAEGAATDVAAGQIAPA